MTNSRLKWVVLDVLSSNRASWLDFEELCEMSLVDPQLQGAKNALRKALGELDVENRVDVRMVGSEVLYRHQTKKKKEYSRVSYVPGNRGGHTSITKNKDWPD